MGNIDGDDDDRHDDDRPYMPTDIVSAGIDEFDLEEALELIAAASRAKVDLEDPEHWLVACLRNHLDGVRHLVRHARTTKKKK